MDFEFELFCESEYYFGGILKRLGLAHSFFDVGLVVSFNIVLLELENIGGGHSNRDICTV